MHKPVNIMEESQISFVAKTGPIKATGRTPLRVLVLDSEPFLSFFEVWLGILLWMAASYMFVYFAGAAVSLLALRKHPWFPLFSLPLLAMAFVGPATFGAVTSASIALPLSAANQAISSVHCMLFGCVQTVFIIAISFSRILATL